MESLRSMASDPALGSDSLSTVDIEAKADQAVPEEWAPSKKEMLIMVSLSFISLMVSLDATILVTVLPVSNVPTLFESTGLDLQLVYRKSRTS